MLTSSVPQASRPSEISSDFRALGKCRYRLPGVEQLTALAALHVPSEFRI